MQKIKTSKQVDDLYNKVISEKLLGHTCQFFKENTVELKPFGSGVFVVINEIHFVFTASHVANALADNNNDLFIKVGYDKYLNVVGRVKYTDLNKSRGLDLAYIKLDDLMIPPLIEDYSFLTVDKIRKHNKLLVGAANYCVIGFPETNIIYENGELNTFAQAYFTFPTNDNPYKYYKLSKEDWIILQMTGKSQDIITKAKLPMETYFYGLSGCGLWLLMPDTYENSCDYRLIGIMTSYRKGKYFCLIGNKIHHLIKALNVFENMNFKENKIKN
jgi:hypothetical protein